MSAAAASTIIPFWQHARDLRARARDFKLLGDSVTAAILVNEARRYDDAWLNALTRGAAQTSRRIERLIGSATT